MKNSTIIGIGLLAFGGYLSYEYLKKNGLKDMATLQSHDQWELMGYINGLIRGAGSYENAIQSILDWKNYWINANPEITDVIVEWYHYGQQRADLLYPNG